MIQIEQYYQQDDNVTPIPVAGYPTGSCGGAYVHQTQNMLPAYPQYFQNPMYYSQNMLRDSYNSSGALTEEMMRCSQVSTTVICPRTSQQIHAPAGFSFVTLPEPAGNMHISRNSMGQSYQMMMPFQPMEVDPMRYSSPAQYASFADSQTIDFQRGSMDMSYNNLYFQEDAAVPMLPQASLVLPEVPLAFAQTQSSTPMLAPPPVYTKATTSKPKEMNKKKLIKSTMANLERDYSGIFVEWREENGEGASFRVNARNRKQIEAVPSLMKALSEQTSLEELSNHIYLNKKIWKGISLYFKVQKVEEVQTVHDICESLAFKAALIKAKKVVVCNDSEASINV